jgi:hypothetical protein
MSTRYSIPSAWSRAGLVIPRDHSSKSGSVAGDPCIVWDDDIPGWRMVLFYEPGGHAQAVCGSRDSVGPGAWVFAGPIPFANPQELFGYTHKPFIIMDAWRPNHAARIDDRYWLLTVSVRAGHKVVQRAYTERLCGPWTIEHGALIDLGAAADFDAKHVDAVTGFYFPEREETLYFYMGYPLERQDRSVSPFGSAQAVAAQGRGESCVRKLGAILPPCQHPGHWAGGWVGGMQLLPGADHRWIAIVNASPTPPDPMDPAVSREEPPPSLGGFAYCNEPWPIKGWHWCPEPIEWMDQIPATAIETGEGVNLWRHHILCLPDGTLALFYNSGSYGTEQIYGKISRP